MSLLEESEVSGTAVSVCTVAARVARGGGVLATEDALESMEVIAVGATGAVATGAV
jgi:hypothetical protein